MQNKRFKKETVSKKHNRLVAADGSFKNRRYRLFFTIQLMRFLFL